MVEFKSLNFETGMLEDIEEVRQVGIELAVMLRLVLQGPGVRMTTPPDIVHEIAAFAVQSESLLRPMSQREQYQLTTQAASIPKAAADDLERMIGTLSDTLPATHPQVRDKLIQDILDSPSVPNSLKQDALDAYQKGEKQKSRMQPPTTLPPGVESFLRNLGEDGDL